MCDVIDGGKISIKNFFSISSWGTESFEKVLTRKTDQSIFDWERKKAKNASHERRRVLRGIRFVFFGRKVYFSVGIRTQVSLIAFHSSAMESIL